MGSALLVGAVGLPPSLPSPSTSRSLSLSDTPSPPLPLPLFALNRMLVFALVLHFLISPCHTHEIPHSLEVSRGACVILCVRRVLARCCVRACSVVSANKYRNKGKRGRGEKGKRKRGKRKREKRTRATRLAKTNEKTNAKKRAEEKRHGTIASLFSPAPFFFSFICSASVHAVCEWEQRVLFKNHNTVGVSTRRRK